MIDSTGASFIKNDAGAAFYPRLKTGDFPADKLKIGMPAKINAC
jgi:hypothetical protein